ncbi:MAG TPA: serine/threonine-protein kinase [Solimonas sp.]|nr:serine/threonine-protein kinase [Solimonas sp.]
MPEREESEQEEFEATLIVPRGGAGGVLRPAARIPDKIGKYVIRQELGRGASGVVYKSHDPFVKRDVAVKVARHQGLAIPEDTPEGQAFFAEARAAGLLQHPHIVSLFDAGVEGDLFYLVMEYIEGRTLASLCRPGDKRPTLDLVVDIIFKCARALDFAHGKGILHRDIKPSNIMLNMAGLPKIMDFSIAEINVGGAAGSFALSPSLLGSPMYMSPEQARMQRLTPASDLYSLGVVMHQMLTGQPLFRASSLRMLMAMIDRHVPPRIEAWRSDVPGELCNLVARLLSKNPRERPQSGSELAAELALIYDRLRAEGRMLLRRDNSDSLRRLRFFNRFTANEMEEILNVGTLAHYAANAMITQEGEVDNAFYIVAVGDAEMRMAGRLVHRLEKGDCFGEAGFVSASRSTCSVIANSQVLVLKVSDARLEQCSDACQLRFYKTFLESMVHRLSAASAKALKVTWPGG